MKILITLLTYFFTTLAGAATTLQCNWSNDSGVYSFEFSIDLMANTASVLLQNGLSEGEPAKYDCQVLVNSFVDSNLTLICLGPQFAEGVGQVLTSFMIDLSNKTAAAENMLVQPKEITKLTIFPATQCL